MTDRALNIAAPLGAEYQTILSPEALKFVQALEEQFGQRRKDLLAAREKRQKRIDEGQYPDFLPETQHIRDSEWKISPLPEDLQDRRVEITGPVDRKMIINALNSGAKVFMADFEDANSPSWDNCITGQINLKDAVCKTISLEQSGKSYRLNPTTATLLVRPRGLHLVEKHVTLAGQAISGSLFDFGLYVFHNIQELQNRGSGAYFYIPKLESHLEARWWNDVFNFTEEYLKVQKGSIKATVLIETILAAFEMDEILYELREHSAGLNCGRWDYIFSIIKKFRKDPSKVMPDRKQVTMATHMMQSYSLLAIQTCHKRGAPAIGGMSAFIPVKNNEAANAKAFEQVRLDKEREAQNGHDGTWVAHPALVPVALEVFNRLMPTANQISRLRSDHISATDLLTVPEGEITHEGVYTNVSVGLQYLAAWLRGSGAVPIHHLMEDAATAEISRAQLWQWIYHQKQTTSGENITLAWVLELLDQEAAHLKAQTPQYTQSIDEAAALYKGLLNPEDFAEFLTLAGYKLLA